MKMLMGLSSHQITTLAAMIDEQIKTEPIEKVLIACPPNLGCYSGSLIDKTISYLEPKKTLKQHYFKAKTNA